MESLSLVLALLLVAAAVGLAAKRLKVHYNVALVLAGTVLGAARLMPPVRLDPQVVIDVFLPVLLFEAAMSTDLRRLRRNLAPVVLLSVPGMLLTVVVAGTIVRYAIGLGWSVALLLGSILATTDTIAVIATFRKVRVPGRFATIVENESLFNDGTALVAFATLLGVVREGRFDAAATAYELVWVIVAGLGVGLAVGWLTSQVLRKIDDHLLEILMTAVVTYGSWLLAGRVGGSSVIAVVTAGITLGTVGWPFLTPTGKVAIRSVWQVAAFGVNSFVFLLLGLQVRPAELLEAAPAVGWGLLALTLGRAAAVYSMLALLRTFDEPVPLRWQHLLVWGNLKGSLSMALALSLPAGVPHRELLITVVFGATLVTLTGQGLTLAAFAKALGMAHAGEAERSVQEHQGRLLAARAAQAEVDRLQHLGLLPVGVFQRLRASYQGAIARSERQLRELLTTNPDEEKAQLDWVRRHLLVVEKDAVQGAATSGILSDEVAAELAAQIDRGLVDVGRAEGRQ